MKRNATIAAKSTRVPAAARKSQLKGLLYAASFFTIGGSLNTTETGFPLAFSSYVPGQKKLQ